MYFYGEIKKNSSINKLKPFLEGKQFANIKP